MEFALTCAFAAALGLGIGVLSGLLGVGGGTMIVPVLKLGFGLDAISATATSLFAIVPTSLSGAVGHVRAKSCLPKLGLVMGLGGALASPAGVWLATKSPDFAIMGAAACVIAYSAFTMLSKAIAKKSESRPQAPANAESTPVAPPAAGASAAPAAPPAAGASAAPPAESTPAAPAAAPAAGASAAAAATPAAVLPLTLGPAGEVVFPTHPEPSQGAGSGDPAMSRRCDLPPSAAGAASEDSAPAPASAAAFALTRKRLLQGFAICLVAGVASGYVGLGGGFLMVPLMLALMGLPMRLASGTSLIAIVILAVPGVAYQAALGNVEWLAGAAIAAGSVPSALVGARLAPRVPERTLRLAFAALLFVAAALLVLEQLGALG